MYTNKVSIAMTEKECILQFDFMEPELDEEGRIKSVNVMDTQRVTMTLEMLQKVNDLISKAIVDNAVGEKADEHS